MAPVVQARATQHHAKAPSTAGQLEPSKPRRWRESRRRTTAKAATRTSTTSRRARSKTSHTARINMEQVKMIINMGRIRISTQVISSSSMRNKTMTAKTTIIKTTIKVMTTTSKTMIRTTMRMAMLLGGSSTITSKNMLEIRITTIIKLMVTIISKTDSTAEIRTSTRRTTSRMHTTKASIRMPTIKDKTSSRIGRIKEIRINIIEKAKRTQDNCNLILKVSYLK